MISFEHYELRPFRVGQVCVTRDAGDGFVAYQSVGADDNRLTWEALNPRNIATLAAINGYCAAITHSEEGVWHPQYAVSQRQLAQLVAHRSALAALALMPTEPLVKIAFQSLNAVLRAVSGDNVEHTLNALSRLGLDIGSNRNRKALQTVINLAEKTACEHRLAHLAIQPSALDGFVNAVHWIDYHATPLFLNELALMAKTNELARDLAEHTTAIVPIVAPVMLPVCEAAQ